MMSDIEAAGPEPTRSGTDGQPAPGPRRPTLSELALGGALLVGDNVAARLEVSGEPVPVSPTLDSVLRPVAEWDRSEPLAAARQTTIGMLAEARQQAGQSGRLVDEATDALGRSLDRVTRPVRRSRPLRPVRRRFHAWQARGESIVSRWRDTGRREEARSRAVAEASLGTFVHRSVTDITQSDQVQVLVQQVVQSQSTGLIEEILEEIRERMVSLDVLLSRRLRRASVAAPPFRTAYLRQRPALAVIPGVEWTMAGQYAGFASRAVALLIDLTLLMVALSLATNFINALVGLLNIDALLGRFFPADTVPGAVNAGLAGLTGTLLIIVYGVTTWSINGQTLGDLLMGVRIVRTDGRRVSLGHAILRMVGSYIAGLAFFAGFLWALVDGRRQGWHDKLAATVVVYDWAALPDEEFLREELQVTPVLPLQQRGP